MFEENRNLLVKMRSEGMGNPAYGERIDQSAIHIGRIRAMLNGDTSDPDAQVKKKPRITRK
nr:hypothetical protein [uncultured Duganella sp.]